MADQDIRSVLVTNISPSANEKTVSDFFSFCGKISKLYLKKEDAQDTSSAIIQFETESAAKTALLLTNALIVDRPITVNAYISNPNPQPSSPSLSPSSSPTPTPLSTPVVNPNINTENAVDPSKITQKDFGNIPDDQRSKTSVVASLLAAGYILGENVLEKAKEIDEKTSFSSRAKVTVDQLKVKAKEIDVELGISDKASMIRTSITESAKSIDTQFGISKTASTAATAIKNTATESWQKAQENPTIKKGIENVKTTAQKVSTSVIQTFDNIKTQTNLDIEEDRAEKKAAANTTETVDTSSAPVPIQMESPPAEMQQ